MPKVALDRLKLPAAASSANLAPIAADITPGTLLQVLDAWTDPVCLKDRDHRWISVNAAFCDYMGRARRDLIGMSDGDFLSAREARIVWESDEAVFVTGREEIVDEAVKPAGGTMSPVRRTHKSLIRGVGDSELLLVVLRDVSAGDAARALQHGNPALATTPPVRHGKRRADKTSQQVRFVFSDPLTQLPDRRAFMNLLDATAADLSHGAAVLMINIDHFKLVNDRFGHTTGDSVILEVASRLRSAVRVNDVLARLDSDEFAVFANGIDAMAADQIANQVLAEVARPLRVGAQEYRISVSVGIAMAPEHGRGADELVRNARLAMSRRKHRSRGGSELYCEAGSSIVDRMTTIELKLPLALENGELEVYYQPVVGAADHAVSGFEALARWHDPELGELPPTEFIPIAEEMGAIHHLGQVIFEQSCNFAASLSDPKMIVSVNVSGSQLMDETFPIFVAETLQKHALSGDRIFLEMTESVAMDANAMVRQIFDELSAIGVRLIVDDFGTGFSNLARLKQLPFAAVKIDREFIRDLPDSQPDRAIFRATQAIAKELGLQIVAEGVENQAQDEFVCTYGADYLQGFMFGRPVPAEKLSRYTCR